MRDGWLSDTPPPPQYVYYFFTSNGHTQDAIHTLSSAKFKEGWEGTQRELARQAELPSSGRGSAIHLRLSNVLNYAPEGDKDSAMAVLSGARRHKDWRRRELVLQRLRDSVKRLQDGRDGAESVRSS